MPGTPKSCKFFKRILAEYRRERGDVEAENILRSVERLRPDYPLVDLEGLFAAVLEMSKTRTGDEIVEYFEKAVDRTARRFCKNAQLMDEAERTDPEAPARN